MTMVVNGIGLQGDLSHLKNDLKLQDMIVSSPTSSLMYMAGMAISELVYALPSVVMLIILSFFFLHVGLLAALVIAAVMLLIFIVGISLGFFFATLTADVIQSWAFGGMLSTLLSTLPPVYYPITYIPMPYQYLAYISPTTYAAEIAQSAAGFVSFSPATIIIDWVVLVSVAVVLLLIAGKKSRWREI